MDTFHQDSALQSVEALPLDFHNVVADRPPIPTPPTSNGSSPAALSTDGVTLSSVSMDFHPGNNHDTLPSDLVVLSTDSVLFHVHSHVLLAASENSFGYLLPLCLVEDYDPSFHVPVPETSEIFNIVLHCIYDISCAHHSPSFDTLVAAVTALDSFGVPLKNRILPLTSLYTLLLSHAPLHPLELYTLAASYDLYDLAVSTSPHLLSFSLATLSDDMAERIGPTYLKRLFFLHFGRVDALKRILQPPPRPHVPTKWCDFTDQEALTRAWAFASAHFAWEARPDLSTKFMTSALNPLVDSLSCGPCRQILEDRIRTLVVQWSLVKRTI